MRIETTTNDVSFLKHHRKASDVAALRRNSGRCQSVVCDSATRYTTVQVVTTCCWWPDPNTQHEALVNEELSAVIDWVIYALAGVLLIGAAEIGAALARRNGAPNRESADRFLSTLVTPTLGLLALMVGFTFAMALSRFETRQAAVLAEANAIGTAALRGRMLPEPHASTVAELFKKYARLRVTSRGRPLHAASNAAAVHAAVDIQERLWREAMAVASVNPQVVPVGLFIQALNGVIDAHQTRITVGQNRVPMPALGILLAIAFISIGLLGYGQQWAGGYRRSGTWTVAAVIAGVIILIVDIDAPQRGFININQQPLWDLIGALPK